MIITKPPQVVIEKISIFAFVLGAIDNLNVIMPSSLFFIKTSEFYSYLVSVSKVQTNGRYAVYN